MKIWLYDVENYSNFFCVTFYSNDSDEYYTFIIDKFNNDRSKILSFIRERKILVGYNSKTYDDVILNYIIANPKCTCLDLYNLGQKIIALQKRDDGSFYKELRQYLHSDKYFGIDLMRLLFSRKLRVSLKELECSLNFHNVEELPYAFDSTLSEEQKKKIASYNVNDCKATKLVLEKSMEALKLRKWMNKEYGIDAYSLDGVNAGVRILEVLYEKEVGNNAFRNERTFREWVDIKDIILPIVKFDTPEFNKVLNVYKNHRWYSKHFDEQLFVDSKLKFEPVINNFRFKYSLGGLHGDTKGGFWESNDDYEILSVDVDGYYPSMMVKYGFFPGHLNMEVLRDIFIRIGIRRDEAKKAGETVVSETLKLSRNGVFGNLGQKFSWLFDHKARLQICVNGQLMLSMLVEKFFQEGITLIDVNTRQLVF